MSTLRAIVVGSGWGAHSARALAADARVTLAALVGRRSERTTALASELGVTVEASIDDAIAAHRPQLVVLAVSEHSHEALAIRALDADCHVLCAHPVAARAPDVLRIARAALRAGKLARTDYTFRLRPELDALRAHDGRGALLRVAIDAPGRWLPIVLDTAVVIAGPVVRLTGNRSYPNRLAQRVAHVPQAFPPAALLEHRSGAVTSIVTFPHSWPAVPVHVRTSWEGGRVEALLPTGGARRMALGRSGAVEERDLVSASCAPGDPSSHGLSMQAVARAFVDEILGAGRRLATLDEEAHLRAVWDGLWRASREWIALEDPDIS
ncbi:MAG: Gfo/Idh/MocA family oxidoreductase [Deltaproteobacteria bacterium]|nr:Gfo/Idh/MocA family oxidoreductase [Deltaproteobacteria bacterium]